MRPQPRGQIRQRNNPGSRRRPRRQQQPAVVLPHQVEQMETARARRGLQLRNPPAPARRSRALPGNASSRQRPRGHETRA